MLRRTLQSNPIFGVFILLFACLFFRLLDIFAFRLDEKIGEIILSKSIGFILIFLFLSYIGKSLKDIHLSRINPSLSLKLAIFQAVLALCLCFGMKFFFLSKSQSNPMFALSHEFTIIQIILFVFIGNLVNTLMEEGLFRGFMITTFMKKMPFWLANLLQATLFGLWHIPWIIRDYTSGEIAFGAMVKQHTLCHYFRCYGFHHGTYVLPHSKLMDIDYMAYRLELHDESANHQECCH